jgi:hypothetical protein
MRTMYLNLLIHMAYNSIRSQMVPAHTGLTVAPTQSRFNEPGLPHHHWSLLWVQVQRTRTTLHCRPPPPPSPSATNKPHPTTSLPRVLTRTTGHPLPLLLARRLPHQPAASTHHHRRAGPITIFPNSTPPPPTHTHKTIIPNQQTL